MQTFETTVCLNGLEPSDVAVELVYGDVDASDELRNVRISRFELCGDCQPQGDAVVFHLDKLTTVAGVMGFTVRDEANPEGDIAIRYTGLRHGEKLHEVLLSASERGTPSRRGAGRTSPNRSRMT